MLYLEHEPELATFGDLHFQMKKLVETVGRLNVKSIFQFLYLLDCNGESGEIVNKVKIDFIVKLTVACALNCREMVSYF